MMINVVSQCYWFLLQKLCLKTLFQVIMMYCSIQLLYGTVHRLNSLLSSHRKLKKSIEEVGTDFLLLPNAFTQVTLEIMSKMAGRHQLITLSAHRGGEKFS